MESARAASQEARVLRSDSCKRSHRPRLSQRRSERRRRCPEIPGSASRRSGGLGCFQKGDRSRDGTRFGIAVRLLVDTNVFLYARGSDHPYREPCRRLLDAVARGQLRLDASTELIQEFLHVLLRRGIPRDQALEEAGEVRRLCRVTAFDNQVLTTAIAMIRKYPALGARDTVHAATAVVGGISKILSADQVFDGLDEVERVDPLGILELLKL